MADEKDNEKDNPNYVAPDGDDMVAPEEDPNNLPPVDEKSDSGFKQFWRNFAIQLTAPLNGEMEENTESANFVAKIKDTKGNKTSIAASSYTNVALSAETPDGKRTIPDLKVFKELAQKANDSDLIVNFRNIQSPEFKARLLIACMEKEVPMQNAPKIDEEFLNSIEPESAKYIKILLNKQNYRGKQSEEKSNEQTTKNNEQGPNIAAAAAAASKSRD